MGLMSKLSGADKMVEIRDEAIASIKSQLDSGQSEARYLLTQERIGTRNRMDTFGGWLCKQIEIAGYRVVNATESGWDYKSVITVARK
jgi:hypothetical protein